MKKTKLKKKWLIIFLVIIILMIYPTFLTIRIVSKNYKLGSVISIVMRDLKDQVLAHNYSKTLEVAIKDKAFKQENVDSYFEIDYYEQKDFIASINTLLEKGYQIEQINAINQKLSNEMIKTLYEHEIIKDISNYLEFDYFKSENLYRYIDYYYGDYQEAVVYVNIGLDKEYYVEPNLITEFSVDVLANKYNKLDESFEPDNLTKIKDEYIKNERDEYLSKVAAVAFENMCEEALADDMHLMVNSAYRSYQDQEDVYNTYLELYGQQYVNNYVAVPGYSEHQTGLAIDIASKDHTIFVTSPEYTWMLDNGYKYGFILRYPKEKQEITGYKNEDWHFRYVGVEVAKYIQDNQITYDEYYVMFLDR